MSARSVNERVAEAVGWVCPDCKNTKTCLYDRGQYSTPGTCYCDINLPSYESSLDAAMTAYEAMRSRGWTLMAFDEGRYRVRLHHKKSRVGWGGNGPTLSAAICAAILSAAESEKRPPAERGHGSGPLTDEGSTR